jgi:Domain of unknown function (DUF4399)
MKIKSLLSAFVVLTLAACNNSSDTAVDAAKDTAKHDMDHEHPAVTSAVAETENPPAGAKVFFKNLKAGQTISSPYKLEMGVEGMKVDTAGPLVSGAGHHHLMIDGPDSLAKGTVVAKDSVNIHFGKGQTEYELKLKPGKHKLTLQFADGIHRAYGGQMSATVEVNVKQ